MEQFQDRTEHLKHTMVNQLRQLSHWAYWGYELSHIKETYQPTSRMRWDSIFPNGSNDQFRFPLAISDGYGMAIEQYDVLKNPSLASHGRADVPINKNANLATRIGY